MSKYFHVKQCLRTKKRYNPLSSAFLIKSVCHSFDSLFPIRLPTCYGQYVGLCILALEKMQITLCRTDGFDILALRKPSRSGNGGV